MKQNKNVAEWFSGAAQWLVALASFVAFAILAAISLIQTCHVDIDFTKDNSEHVSFLNDNILLNIAILAVLLLLGIFLMRTVVKRKMVVCVGAVSIALSSAIGVWWVLSSKALPGADSLKIISAAQRLIQGGADALTKTDYFKIYPYQTGYLLFAEGFLRLFGANQLTAFQLTNVVFVALAQVATLGIARKLFDDPRVELLTAILLGLCIQPVLLSTFLYGTLPGMAFAIWSIYFVVDAITRRKFLKLIPAAVLIALAILLKKNFWLVLIAESAAILLFALRDKKWLMLGGMALMIALSAVLPPLTQTYYENRTDTVLGKGTPQMAWLVTGFRDSSLCAGWFNGYTNNVLRENDYDYEKTLAQNKVDFIERAEIFISRPIYLASFFYHKIVSQWNEPAFQSTWSSATTKRSGEVSMFVQDLGKGNAAEIMNDYLNQLMQFVYVTMAVGFFILLVKKEERSEVRMIIPLILVGAALYHALFEAKSQYAIIYVPMMLPYAAYGAKKLMELIKPKKKVKINDTNKAIVE